MFLLNEAATATTYTLFLHDALPISAGATTGTRPGTPGDIKPMTPAETGPGTAEATAATAAGAKPGTTTTTPDRKSTRLNSSHPSISYAVFCLKKKKLH